MFPHFLELAVDEIHVEMASREFAEIEIIGEIAPKLFARLDTLLASKPDAVVIFEMPGEQELNPAGWRCVKRLGKGGRQPTAAIFRKVPALPATG